MNTLAGECDNNFILEIYINLNLPWFFRWDDSFYYAGIFIALSGVCSYMIEFCEKKATKESDSDVSETKKAQLLH